MKVCFIAGTLDRGGAEHQLIFMLQALIREGVGTRVLSLTRGEALESRIKDLGVDVEWVGSRSGRLSRALQIIKCVRSERTDIVQSAHFYTNIYAGIAGRSHGVKSIGAIRSDLVSEVAANGLLGRWQLKLPHHLIANTQTAKIAAVERGIPSDKIDFVRNVVEMNELNVRNGDKTEDINILFVGRLVAVKRPEWFIRLAVKLISDLPDRKLLFKMAGDGPLRKELGQLAKHHGLSPNQFKFLGESERVGDLYGKSDIVVLTSKHEGTPNVLLEAMSHRVPVVATCVGGVPEIIDAERGFLVAREDFDAMVAATKKLIANDGLRHQMGAKGKEYTAGRHSIDDLGTQLVKIYSKLAAITND